MVSSLYSSLVISIRLECVFTPTPPQHVNTKIKPRSFLGRETVDLRPRQKRVPQKKHQWHLFK
jgi:hypothetical protein